MENGSPQKKQWKILLPVLLLLFTGLGLIILDRDRIAQVLGEADWALLPPALLFVSGANYASSFSFVILAEMVGIQTDRYKLAKAFFVTNAMNRLLGSGGAAGFSLRCLMLKPYGVSLNDVLNSSFIHFLLSTLVVFSLLPVMIAYVLITLPVSVGMVYALMILAAIGAALGFGVVFVLINRRFRWNVGRLVVWMGKKLIRRDITPSVNEFMLRANAMVSSLRQDPKGLSIVMLMLLGEWAANVLLLKYCLSAFGANLPFSGSATLYVLGTMAGGITGLPGGIGVQEAIMTSLAVLQGASFAQAALAAILYRILQTFLPFLLSFGYYPRLLRTKPARMLPAEERK